MQSDRLEKQGKGLPVADHDSRRKTILSHAHLAAGKKHTLEVQRLLYVEVILHDPTLPL